MLIQTSGFSRISRRAALASVALAAGSIGLRQAAGAQDAGLSSGALGMSRADIEARWGEGERVDVGGHPIYDETYAYPGQGSTTYVWYMAFNGLEVAAYVEVDFGPEGVPMVQARDLITNYLPADAKFSELFIAPATPGGPTALAMTRYLSPALSAAYEGIIPAEILVTVHESWPENGDPERATAISLMARMVTQQG